MCESFKTSSKIRRRKWSEEERRTTLNQCGNKCARCGKKLTLTTLTMDHVIPISKGGENVQENLVALCQPCNLKKANNFCWPQGYYFNLNEGYKRDKVCDYVNDWVYNHVTLETIKQYPMIAEVLGFKLDLGLPTKKPIHIPSLTYDLFEITSETMPKLLKDLNLTPKDFYDTTYRRDTFSLIGLRSYASNEVKAIYTLQLVSIDKAYYMFISEVYSKSVDAGEAVPAVLLGSIIEVWNNYRIRHVVVRTKESKIIKHLVDRLQNNGLNPNVAGSYKYGVDAHYKNDWKWVDANNTLIYTLDCKHTIYVEED